MIWMHMTISANDAFSVKDDVSARSSMGAQKRMNVRWHQCKRWHQCMRWHQCTRWRQCIIFQRCTRMYEYEMTSVHEMTSMYKMAWVKETWVGLARTMYSSFFWQGNHQIHSKIRCIFMVQADPRYEYCWVWGCAHLSWASVCVCEHKRKQ